jgi:hypothetical protein
MAIESANYFYIPSSGTEDDLIKVLDLHHAERMERARTWVIRGHNYWIDIMIQQGPQVSIRVALTNPPAVVEHLRKLLDAFWNAFPGKLVAPHESLSFTNWGEQEWKTIVADYRSRRDQFRRHYGEIEAPISADAVWNVLDSKGQDRR